MIEFRYLDDGNASIECECGRKYHVSVFRHRILVAVREAIRLARLDDAAIEELAASKANGGN
jgi:hypothetical protein